MEGSREGVSERGRNEEGGREGGGSHHRRDPPLEGGEDGDGERGTRGEAVGSKRKNRDEEQEKEKEKEHEEGGRIAPGHHTPQRPNPGDSDELDQTPSPMPKHARPDPSERRTPTTATSRADEALSAPRRTVAPPRSIGREGSDGTGRAGSHRNHPSPSMPLPPRRDAGQSHARTNSSSSSSSPSSSGSGSSSSTEANVAEVIECFRIVSAGTLARSINLDEECGPSGTMRQERVALPERMRDAGYCKPEMIDELWTQKNRMDSLFDQGLSSFYYQARDQTFPQDRKGSARFWNRAGDKLREVVDEVGLFKGLSSPIVFIDICGGPGAFTQLILGEDESHGYGMTLKLEDTPQSDIWYRQLGDEPRFKISWGSDGTGSVYEIENLRRLQRTIVEDGDAGRLNLVVGDGGFEIQRNEKGEHMENYQELFSGRIIMSELLIMLMTLQKGGSFVCKMFDSFSALTASFIYTTTLIFEEVYIVKPIRSRIVNSERYLVGKNLKAHDDTFNLLRDIYVHLHGMCTDDTNPLSMIPIDIMKGDQEFMRTMCKMNESICAKQRRALQLVMDRVDELKRQSPGDSPSRGRNQHHQQHPREQQHQRHPREQHQQQHQQRHHQLQHQRRDRERHLPPRPNRPPRERSDW